MSAPAPDSTLERHAGAHLDADDEDFDVNRERKQRHILSQLRELDHMNQDLSARVQGCMIGDAVCNPLLDAQKQQLRNRVLNELVVVTEAKESLGKTLKGAAGLDNLAAKSGDPALMAKELKEKDKRIVYLESELHRLLKEHDENEGAAAKIHRDLGKKIAAFSTVRKHNAAEKRTLENRVAELEAQTTYASGVQ